MQTKRGTTTRKRPNQSSSGHIAGKEGSGGKINLPYGCIGRVLQGCGRAAWDGRAPSNSCSHVVGSRLASRSATCQHHWCRGLEAGSPCGHSRLPAAADGNPRWRWRRSRREQVLDVGCREGSLSSAALHHMKGRGSFCRLRVHCRVHVRESRCNVSLGGILTERAGGETLLRTLSALLPRAEKPAADAQHILRQRSTPCTAKYHRHSPVSPSSVTRKNHHCLG